MTVTIYIQTNWFW